MGEDVGSYGGVFRATEGLFEKFGPERVRDTPISEAAIISVGLGAAIMGMNPIVEIMYCDFLCRAFDEIVNQTAKMTYMSGGQVKVPLVIRTSTGAFGQDGPQHSQSLESIFSHIPGLTIVLPSNAYDAKGLLKTAINFGNPVMFFEHKAFYSTKSHVPKEEYTIPFGRAAIKREGTDVTIIALGYMVNEAMKAAQMLAEQNINADVIDPRTLVPLDTDTVVASVKKTGKAVIAYEACQRGGFGAEIASVISEKAFGYLDSPIKRVSGPDTPVPFAPYLESRWIRNYQDIINAVREIS